MLNFIVFEDNKIVLQKNVDIVNKVMFDNDIDYKVYSFTSNVKNLKNLISKNLGNNIYILDIELDDITGIDIAREIRKIDFESIIIISTTHTDYLPYTLKSKLMIFDFVSKFEDYEENLKNTISKALVIYKENKNRRKVRQI